MLDFWIRESDERRLEFTYNTHIRPYAQKFLTGEMDDPGLLEKVKEYFTVASWMLGAPQGAGPECDFAYVGSAALYPQGVVLTPFKARDIKLDHHNRWVHRKDRIEMTGSDGEDFPSMFFRNYTGSFKAQQVNEWHAFLYRDGVQEFEVDVPGSFPIEELDPLLRRGGVLTDGGVRGSKYVGVISVNGRRLLFSNWAHHVEESMKRLPEFITGFMEERVSNEAAAGPNG